MCNPVAAFAVSAASSMAKFGAAQEEYTAKKAVWNQNYQNALAAGRDDFRALTLRQMQEAGAYAQKDRLQVLDAAQRQAAINVSAASANVQGLSVDNIIGDVARKTEANRATLQTNWEMTASQLQAEKDGAVSKEQSRINSVANPIAPDPTGTMLEIAGAGVKYGAQMQM
jgi:hypothetical protein